MSKRLNKEIELNEIGHESVLLEHVEIDEEMIPLHHLQSLPNPLLANSFIYIGDEGSEWICVVITDDSHQWTHYKAWFKNGKKIK